MRIIILEMKCMLQRVYFLINFSGVAQKNDWKTMAFVRNAICRSFQIFFCFLALHWTLENQIPAAVPQHLWCRVETAWWQLAGAGSEDGPYLLLCSPWIANKYCPGDFSYAEVTTCAMSLWWASIGQPELLPVLLKRTKRRAVAERRTLLVFCCHSFVYWA